jgi:hypothetical protein
MAFASNLLGAIVGGAIEYVALVSGYQALLIIVGLLYLGAYVLAHQARVLGDRDLELGEATESPSTGRAMPDHADLPT